MWSPDASSGGGGDLQTGSPLRLSLLLSEVFAMIQENTTCPPL